MKQGPFAQTGLCCPDRHHYYDPLRLPLDRPPLPGITGYRKDRFPSRTARGRGGSLQFRGQPSNHSTPPAPGGSSAPAPRSLVPSMAFALKEQARLLLVRLSTDRRNDAAGFTSCCGLVSCSAPLRTRPLNHARGPHYRGPWRLPGPDSHRPADNSFTLGYMIKLLSIQAPEQSGRTKYSGGSTTLRARSGWMGGCRMIRALTMSV